MPSLPPAIRRLLTVFAPRFSWQKRPRDLSRWRVAGLLGLLLVLPLQSIAAGQPEPEGAAPGLTVDDLRRGGYVIFFRHTTADQGSDAAPVDLDDCTTQRNMSEAGLRDARTIGQAFRRLAIPVGQVLSSEYCRTLETARVTFGRAEPASWLTFCCNDTRPLTQELRFQVREQALATPPPAGVNTVLVGHTQDLNQDLAQGEAAIYQPDGRGGFVRVARVLPSEWMTEVYPPGDPR